MKKKLKNVGSIIERTNKPIFFDWIVVSVMIIFCYFSFNHADILCTASHGRDLVQCVFQGEFMNFYDYTKSTAVYSITVYILFAIWSLPVMLVYKIMGMELWALLDFLAIPYPVLLWYKLLPTLFYFGIAFLLYKIILEIKKDKNIAKWVAFLFVSSPISIFSQYIFGQYDSLGLFLAVWAFYMYIKKRYYFFSVLCSVAITFKLFAIFLFVPLILLVEKRIINIIKHGSIAISGYVITTLMFLSSQGYKDAMNFSGNVAPRLFEVGIVTAMGTISVFTVSIMLICVWAYSKHVKEINEFYCYAIYISFVVFGSLFAFIFWHPQWVMFLIPFMSLAFVLNHNYNSSLILHSAMAVGYLGVIPMAFPGNVDANMLHFGLFTKFFGEKAIGSINDLISLGDMGKNLFYSLFAGAIIILIISCFPNNVSNCNKIVEEPIPSIGDRIFILARPLTLSLFILPALYVFFN